MIKRRQFLMNGGLALGALALSPSLAFASKKKAIGIQLYTLSNSLPKDVKGVLAQVGKAGFKEVETFGYSATNGFFGIRARDFQSILKDNGLKAVSNHFDFNGYIKDADPKTLNSYIDTAHILGSEYLTIPYIVSELRGESVDDYKKLATKINKIGEICHSNGLKLAYHNHDFEFTKFENTCGFEVLLNETDRNLVDFEMDLFWVVRSGNNPLDLFKEHPGRFKMWHVKDMDKVDQGANAEIGSGSIDFKSIFAQAKLAGMEHFFLEQESNYNPNPIESIKTSFDYIDKNLI